MKMSIYAANKFAGNPAFHPIAYHSVKEACGEKLEATASGFWVAVKTKYEVFKKYRMNRAALQHLAKLDDSALCDIGITRSDVIWAGQLPHSQNAALELENIARTRK